MSKVNACHAALISWMIFLFSGCLVPAATAAPTTHDLNKIHLEIKDTQNRISKNQKEGNALAKSLEEAEISLSTVVQEKNHLNAAIQAQKEELEQLRIKEKALHEAKIEQEKKIHIQLNASYRLGHEKNVKAILNQQESSTLSRSLVYSDYITHARFKTLKTFEATLQQIADNATAIEHKTTELDANRIALAEKEAALQASYTKRNASLKTLNASIKNDESKIAQLKSDQARLQLLMDKIRAQQNAAKKAAEKARIAQEKLALSQREKKQATTTAEKPVIPQKPAKVIAPLDLPADHLPFSQTKGKLRWPAQGKLDNRYGKTRQPGDFRWEGIAFIAPMGSNINAIHSGRIVFADWFRGKGLLVIIDHGNGYMSLYAHNQTLLKKTGELVKTGEHIATLGNSGGLDNPELYFEIRYQGEPVNPAYWLKGSS